MLWPWNGNVPWMRYECQTTEIPEKPHAWNWIQEDNWSLVKPQRDSIERAALHMLNIKYVTAPWHYFGCSFLNWWLHFQYVRQWKGFFGHVMYQMGTPDQVQSLRRENYTQHVWYSARLGIFQGRPLDGEFEVHRRHQWSWENHMLPPEAQDFCHWRRWAVCPEPRFWTCSM